MDWTKITSDTLIITANQRLVFSLTEAYNTDKKQKNERCWPTLKIKALTSWTIELFGLLPSPPGLLLTPEQQLLLWQNIVKRSELIPDFSINTPFLNQIINAWSLLQQWEIPLNELKQEEHLESQFFYHLALAYQHDCEKHNWLDTDSLPAILVKHLTALSAHLPKQLCLVGFEDASPSLKNLIAVLKHYCHIIFVNTAIKPKDTQLIEYNDDEEEIKNLAFQLLKRLEQQPNSKIGLIVPNLLMRKAQIHKIFKKTAYELNISSETAFRFSTSPALGNYSIIQTALKIIALLKPEIELTDIFFLLRSPYVTSVDPDEFEACYKLDHTLRKYNQYSFSLRELSAETRKYPALSALTKRFESVIELKKNLPSDPANTCQWSNVFILALKAFNWPNLEKSNSKDFQISKRFHELLNNFSQLSLIQAEITFDEALCILKQLSDNTLYQPQETHNCVQIMGALEALGQNFDYLWIAGMSEAHWPSDNRPNPFLSLDLQKKFHMPFSSIQKKNHFYDKISNQLLQMSPHITISYVSKQNNAPVTCSPYFKHLAATHHCEDNEAIQTANNLEYFFDPIGPPFQKGKETLEGGTNLFRLQANCPFKAFAQLRLKAKPLPQLYLGLSKQDQGTLLHETLYWIWQKLETQEKLLALTKDELIQLVENSIEKAFISIIKKMPKKTKTTLMTAEKHRLLKIIIQWLEHEKQRQPFTVIQSEKRNKIKINGLELSIQADRIDKLQDNSTVIIDYKTSEYNILEWLAERFTEPQLPLYCVYHDANIKGIVIAEITAKTQRFKGISIAHESIPGTSAPSRFSPHPDQEAWQAMKNEWRLQIEQLLENFLQGHAEVDPKEAKSCHQCNLQTMCRIYEYK